MVNGKYEPLYQYLSKQTNAKVILTFNEIEKMIESDLPVSAHGRNQWWSNSRTDEHPHSRAWQDAGYETTDVESSRKLKQMTFKKI